MITFFKFIFITMGFIHSAHALSALPKYTMAVKVNPDNNSLQVEGKIENFPTHLVDQLYLNQLFTIISVTAENISQKLNASIDQSSPSPDFINVAKKINIPEHFRGTTLHFKYSGSLAKAVNEVNIISPHLIELALYSGWYPYIKGLNLFDFDVKLTVPKNFKATSNGIIISEESTATEVTYEFKSLVGTNDIVLIAAPQLQTIKKSLGSLEVEMVFPQATKINTLERIEDITDALNIISDWYGHADNGFLRFVFSPREGWGYSRLPLFVVSNARAELQESDLLKKETNIQGNIHELSHFWWQIADINTPDDWINEGLAEYSSFSYASQKFGKGFRNYLMNQYLDDISKNHENISIVDTKSDSSSRYVNRYEKTTILFCLLEKKFGRQKLIEALRAFYVEFKGTRKATTTSFLVTLKKYIGIKATHFAQEYLSTPWEEARVKNAKNELLL
jgi:Peptidase family M1 domain